MVTQILMMYHGNQRFEIAEAGSVAEKDRAAAVALLQHFLGYTTFEIEARKNGKLMSAAISHCAKKVFMINSFISLS